MSASPSLHKSEHAKPKLTEHLDGEAGDAFGSCSASLQGGQETESETHPWEPDSHHVFFLTGTAWGWQRIQAETIVDRAVTDRGSASSEGRMCEDARQKHENSHTHVYFCK